jgi:hypothetical protein
MKVFQDEEESSAIDTLTIENRTDRVELYGHLHLTRDKAGLARARELKAIVDDVVRVLEREDDLPEEITLTNKPRPAKNPFKR